MAEMKTVRYRDPAAGEAQLGILRGDLVFGVTRQVPEWTCPVRLWRALRALGLDAGTADAALCRGEPLSFEALRRGRLLLPPVAAPEVWAAGVTYERSREARNAETQIKDSVYDRVYEAERPELFFKSTYARLVPPEHELSLRSDSSWMVPEPELSVALSAEGDIIGYTAGNDLSSRDIEGANPLYLPQAKVFARSCSLGPVLLWDTPGVQPDGWTIELHITRDGTTAFLGSVPFSQFRRRLSDLVSYLRRDNPLLDGTVLMTGTGIVPPDTFTLRPGDIVDIAIEPIGVLSNPIG
jgi:2-dehydro-3-deoxy-D-arabinonate dehydratase